MKLFCLQIFRTSLVLALSVILLACANVQEKEREDKAKFRIADTNVRLGLGYLKQGREEAALEKFKKAIAAMPEYAEAQSSIALAYVRLEMPEKAAEHYQRAVDLKPDDGSIQNNYAIFLCSQGKYEKAKQHFLTAIKSRKYRTPAEALENLGVCMLQANKLKEAETYLRKALKINPRLPGALLQMAKVSVERERWMSGRAYLQRYREVAPLGPAGLWLGIQVETKLGGDNASHEYKALLRQKYADSNEMRLLLDFEEKERIGVSAK
jgi:type IV pilus assembly protein PilF